MSDLLGYFKEEHELFRESLRRFVREEIVPNVEEWEKQGRTPRSLFQKMGQLGFLGAEFPPEYGGAGRGTRSLSLRRRRLQHHRAHRHVLSLAGPVRYR